MLERTAVILAAGKSRRMRSQTSKVLHRILGLPVIRYVIDMALEAGVQRLLVVANDDNREALEQVLVNAQKDWASKQSFDFRVCIQEQARGTGDAVRAAGQALEAAGEDFGTGSVVVLCGDVPLIRSRTLTRFLDAHENNGCTVSVLSGCVSDSTGYGRIVRRNKRFVGIVEERDASEDERAIAEINSGCLAFAGATLTTLLEAIPLAPEKNEYYLTRAIDLALSGEVLGSEVVVEAFSEISEEEILGINTRAQLAQATSILRDRIVAQHMDRGVTFVDPKTAYIDKRVSIGQDTEILPFVVIEGAVKIDGGCRIGPFAHIRGDSHIEAGAALGNFVEVVRSKVGPESRALHLSYLGDTELGRGVNVGAGTIFANWDGREKQTGRVGDEAFLGSGTIVVQPAAIARGARTGAGAVVTHSIPEGETWVGVPARRFKLCPESDGSGDGE